MGINTTELGNRIRFYRTSKGLSQNQLGDMVALNTNHISRIENGQKAPSLESLLNIAKALNVSADQLLIDSLSEPQQNKNDLNSLLLDCTPEEVSILVDNFTGLKKVLSKYQIKE